MPKTNAKSTAVTQEVTNDYWRGYIEATALFTWQCDDCGNTYTLNVENCPNEILDEIKFLTATTVSDKQ